MSGEESCIKYSRRLAKLVAQSFLEEKCDCLLLSGGIDTSFTALSLALHGVRPKAVTVLYDDGSPDNRYARIIVEKLGLKHVVVTASDELVGDCLRKVLRVFKTIDPVEVVCDIPLCIGLTVALREGCKCVMTGDGGDELFFGYSFLLDENHGYLEEWVKRVIGKRFSSEIMGEYLGLKVVPAFYSSKVKEYSRQIPFSCRIRKSGKRIWGKYLLRIFLDEHGLSEIAWREKTPVNIGSGFNILLSQWARRMSFNTVLRLYRESFIHFPSKPHAYLYLKLIEEGIRPPDKCANPRKACPICGRCMVDDHCSFCGASIGRDGRVMVYSDELYHRLRKVMSS